MLRNRLPSRSATPRTQSRFDFPLIAATFSGYTASGVVTTGLEFVILYVLLTGLGLGYVVAVPTAYIVTTLLHYVICHFLVFHPSGRPPWLEFSYFVVILLLGAGLNSLLVSFGVEVLALNVYVARVASGALIMLFNYYANARYNFRI